MAQERFIWPPRAPSAAPPTRATPAAPAPPPSRLRAIARDVESEFLDLTSLPLHERLARAAQLEPDGHTQTIDDGLSACWRCGRSIGAFESDAGGCAWCREMRLPWIGTVRLGAYAGLWAQVVREVKYSRFAQLGHDAGYLLGERIKRRLDDAGVDADSIVVIPVPTHWSRRWVRGIDHPHIIATGVAAALSAGTTGKQTRVPVLPALARQSRPSQTSLPASERRTSLSQTMTLKRPQAWQWGTARAAWRRLLTAPSLTIVLVDDVTTTGATLREACRAIKAGLQPHRPKSANDGIMVGVIAVTDERW